MLVKCYECGEMQSWKAKGGPRLAATPCYKCSQPALRKLTTEEERARRAAFVATLPPRAPVAFACARAPEIERSLLEVFQIAAPTVQAIGEAARAHERSAAHKATVRALAPQLFAQRLARGNFADMRDEARYAVRDAGMLADALAEGGCLD